MIKSVIIAFKEDWPFKKITLLYKTSVEISTSNKSIDYHRILDNSWIFLKSSIVRMLSS